MRFIRGCTVFLLLLAGSDGLRAVEEAALREAVRTYLAQDRPCVHLGGELPITLRAEQVERQRSAWADGEVVSRQIMVLESLRRVDLLRAERVETDMSTGMYSSETRTVSAVRYTLSAAGESHARTQGGEYRDVTTELCYGRYELVEILEHSEPSRRVDRVTTQVTYSYRLVGRREWIQRSAYLSERHPEVRVDLNTTGPLTTTDRVHRIGDDWVHEAARDEFGG